MIKYVFSINPGRCGSHYLCEIFKYASGCVSLHEPEPCLSRTEMVEFNHGNEAPLRSLMPQKLAAMERAASGKVYVETSHFFIMGFGWLLPEYLRSDEMVAIIINRDPAKIGESWLRINRVPGSEKARHSVLHPNGAKNLSRPPAVASPLELCVWHAREVYLRARAYQERFPRMKFLELDLEDLNDLGKVKALFAECGLKATDDLTGCVGVPTNLKKKGNAVVRTLNRLQKSVYKRWRHLRGASSG